MLRGAGAALALPSELAVALANTGAHGLSEVLYAYASAANNNGSAFAGLTGSLAAQKRVEPGAGTLPMHGALFGVLVWVMVVLVAALTFFAALALGPIAEALA